VKRQRPYLAANRVFSCNHWNACGRFIDVSAPATLTNVKFVPSSSELNAVHKRPDATKSAAACNAARANTSGARSSRSFSLSWLFLHKTAFLFVFKFPHPSSSTHAANNARSACDGRSVFVFAAGFCFCVSPRFGCLRWVKKSVKRLSGRVCDVALGSPIRIR
jgi:hypothetical protein